MVLNLMKVSVEDLAIHFNPILIEPDIHRWWTLLGNDVDLVGTGAVNVLHAS